MKIIAKNPCELLETLYGCNDVCFESYSKKVTKEIIEEHMKSLERIYDYLEDTEMEGHEQYDLGDVMNLLDLFTKVIFKEVENENEYETSE